MASGHVSRILYDVRFRAPQRSFLWAVDHPTAQAAYPRVITGRAGPPLLFGLAPRGVCRAADIAACAVGFYSTVSPLPCGAIVEGQPKVFPRAGHQLRLRWRSVFCGTVRSRAVTSSAPWRYQARCPAESGLSSRHSLAIPSDHPTRSPQAL